MTKKVNKIRLYSRLWGFALIGVIIVHLIMSSNATYSVENILNFQFSDSIREFKKLMLKESVLNKEKIQTVKKILVNNTLFDFIFIAFYTILFFLSFKVFELSIGFTLKKKFLLISFIPGLIDCVENMSLLTFLKGMSNEFLFSIYFWSARIKWTAVILFLFMTIAIILYYFLVIVGRVYNIFQKS